MAEEQQTPEKGQTDSYTTPAFWAKEFAAAKKWFQKYHTLARKVEDAYLLERQDESDNESDTANHKYNLFWSNVQTLLSSIYGRLPKVQVERLHLNPADDAARVAGIMLENIFNAELSNIEDSSYYIYQEAIQDRLVAGMGIAWARYTFEEGEQAVPQPDGTTTQVPTITDEEAPIDYVNWDDFLYSPCKRWQQKWWVARRLPMCKDEVAEKWPGKEDTIPYNFKGNTRDNENPTKASVEAQAEVWEIWCIKTKSAYYYVPGAEELLEVKQDPLGLRNFWPCKRPLFATMLSKKCLPRPDFKYAQGQYGELNLVVQRCRLLTEALKVVGVYDKQNEGVQKVLNQANINQLIPVDNWAMFAERGGLKGAIDWFPLDMVIQTLEKLTERKAALIHEIYQVLGISDLQRGVAERRETATTQKLKAQFGSARSDKTQNECARFITEHTRLRAEIICKHWQAETIITRSQIDKTPDARHAQAAVEAMKKDPYLLIDRLSVSADTIAAPDWDLEKQQRIDFLQAISQFIGMAMPVIEKDPTVAPFMIQMLQWASTGFKGAKQIEGVLDQAYQQMQENLQAQAGQPKEPTAEEKYKLAQADKTQAEARLTNLEAALTAIGMNPEMLLSLLVIPPAEESILPAGKAGMPGPGGVPGGQTPGAPPARPTPSQPRPRVGV